MGGHVRRFRRVALRRCAVDRIRRQEELKTLRVGCGRPVALIHIAAAYEFRARRHADLITSAVVSDGRADCVRAVSEVIAWLRRISRARSGAGMDAVMPVVIVTGSHSVPAAIVRLQGGVVPLETHVRSPNNHALTGVSYRPHLRSV